MVRAIASLPLLKTHPLSILIANPYVHVLHPQSFLLIAGTNPDGDREQKTIPIDHDATRVNMSPLVHLYTLFSRFFHLETIPSETVLPRDMSAPKHFTSGNKRVSSQPISPRYTRQPNTHCISSHLPTPSIQPYLSPPKQPQFPHNSTSPQEPHTHHTQAQVTYTVPPPPPNASKPRRHNKATNTHPPTLSHHTCNHPCNHPYNHARSPSSQSQSKRTKKKLKIQP